MKNRYKTTIHTDCQKWFWIPSDVIFENGIIVYKCDN